MARPTRPPPETRLPLPAHRCRLRHPSCRMSSVAGGCPAVCAAGWAADVSTRRLPPWKRRVRSVRKKPPASPRLVSCPRRLRGRTGRFVRPRRLARFPCLRGGGTAPPKRRERGGEFFDAGRGIVGGALRRSRRTLRLLRLGLRSKSDATLSIGLPLAFHARQCAGSAEARSRLCLSCSASGRTICAATKSAKSFGDMSRSSGP